MPALPPTTIAFPTSPFNLFWNILVMVVVGIPFSVFDVLVVVVVGG